MLSNILKKTYYYFKVGHFQGKYLLAFPHFGENNGSFSIVLRIDQMHMHNCKVGRKRQMLKKPSEVEMWRKVSKLKKPEKKEKTVLLMFDKPCSKSL